MPFLTETPQDGDQIYLQSPLGTDPGKPTAAPSLGQTFRAAFDRENTVVNAVRKLSEEKNPIEPGYNPMDDERVKGTRYETEFASSFLHAYSRRDTERVIEDIDREERNARTLNASGAAGTVASVAAGILDPTIFLPGGAVVRAGKGGYSALRSALSISSAAAAQVAAQEGILQLSQRTRSADESMINIGTGTLLASIIGAGAAKVLSRGERKILEKALGDERKALSIPAPAGSAAADLRTGQLRPILPEAVSRTYAKGREAVARVPYVGKVIDKIAGLPEALALRSNPLLRMATSESVASRRAVGDLAALPLETLDNELGITTSKFDIPLDLDVKLSTHQAQVELFDATHKAFQDFRYQGPAKFAAARAYMERKFGHTDGMTFDEFLGEVDVALRNGDRHDIPQVKELALTFRKWFDAVKTMAKEVGIDIGDDVLGAESFAPRVYDRVALTRDRPEFIRRYVGWRTNDQAKKAVLREDLGREWDILMANRAKARKVESRLSTAERRIANVEARLSERGMEAKTTVDRSMRASERSREAKGAVEELRQFIADLKEAGDTAEIRAQIGELERGIKEIEANSEPLTLDDLEAIDKVERQGVLTGPMRKVARILAGKSKALPKPPKFWKWIADNGGVKDSGGDLFALSGDRLKGLYKSDGLQWDDLQVKLMEVFPELRARWEREGLAEDFSDDIRQWIADSANGNEPDWFLEARWSSDDRLVFEMVTMLDEAAGIAGVEFKTMDQVADFMRGEPVAGVTLDDMDRLANEIEQNGAGLDAFVEADGLRQRVAIRQQTIELFKQTITKARDRMAAAKVKGRVADAVQKEAGTNAKRNLGRLGILNKRAQAADGVKAMLEQAQEVAKQVEARQLERIEEILNKWEGKSAREAQGAMKRRGEIDAGRTPEQKAKQSRLGSADKAIARAVRRIMARADDKSEQELVAEAEQTINQILSTPDGRLPKDEPGTVQPFRGGEDMGDVRGSLNARKLPMPDNDLAPFLVKNPLDYAMRYMRQSLSDLGMIARFGDTEGTKAMKEIADDYAGLIRAAETPQRREALQAAMDKDIRDFAAMRDRIKGTYGFDQDAFLQSAGRVAESLKSFNVATLGGGFGLAQFPDFAGVVFRHGLASAFKDAWLPFFSKIKNLKAGGMRAVAGEWAGAGIGAEGFLQARALDGLGMGDVYSLHTPLERTLRAAGTTVATLSGINLMTDVQKIAASGAASNNILRAAKAVAAGNASKRQITALAAGGINEATAVKIWENFSAASGGAEVEGALMPNVGQWTDKAAARRFQAAVLRDVEIAVITPGQEKPLFLSSPIISLIGQFKTFIAAANTRILLANLQRRDANALSGLVTQLALGMLSYAAYTAAKGGEFHERPQDWIKEGFDRSGVLGWFGELNTMGAKATGGRADLFRLIGADKPISRYMSRGLVGNLMGPSFGLAEDVSALTYATANGQWTESDTRKLRRLLPFQNLFYVRQLFDEVERNGNQAFGIEQRSND